MTVILEKFRHLQHHFRSHIYKFNWIILLLLSGFGMGSYTPNALLRRNLDGPDTSRLDPYLIYGFLGPPESAPKRYLDRFSRFCRASECDRQTDRQIDT